VNHGVWSVSADLGWSALPASLRLLDFDQTPTITSEALITVVAFVPAFSPSSSHASLVIEAVMVTVWRYLDLHVRGCRPGAVGASGDLGSPVFTVDRDPVWSQPRSSTRYPIESC
jgi:hypothetical protein